MPSSHRRHRQVCGVNWVGDKSRLSATENFEILLSSLEMRCELSLVLSWTKLFSLQYIEDYWKLSATVANSVHTADKTRLVLSVSAVWTMHYAHSSCLCNKYTYNQIQLSYKAYVVYRRQIHWRLWFILQTIAIAAAAAAAAAFHSSFHISTSPLSRHHRGDAATGTEPTPRQFSRASVPLCRQRIIQAYHWFILFLLKLNMMTCISLDTGVFAVMQQWVYRAYSLTKLHIFYTHDIH